MSLPGKLGSPPPDDRLVESAVRAAAVALDGCPDAEVLGLYAERALDDDTERAAVDAHVGRCARCQAIVADHVRALPVETGGLAGAVPSAVGWFSGWRWMLPLASAAAVGVVAVWIGRNPADGLPEPAPVGQNRLEAQAPQVGRLADSRMVPPANVAVPSSTDLPRRDLDGVSAAGGTAKAASPAAPVATFADAHANRERRQGAAEADKAPAVEAAASPAPIAAEAATQPALAAAPFGAPAGISPGEVAPSKAELGRRSEQAADSAFRAAADPPRWRVREGRVERSVDDGVTWLLVELPTTETVTSVAVRKDGTVVATSSTGLVWTSTDAGASWIRTPPL